MAELPDRGPAGGARQVHGHATNTLQGERQVVVVVMVVEMVVVVEVVVMAVEWCGGCGGRIRYTSWRARQTCGAAAVVADVVGVSVCCQDYVVDPRAFVVYAATAGE